MARNKVEALEEKLEGRVRDPIKRARLLADPTAAHAAGAVTLSRPPRRPLRELAPRHYKFVKNYICHLDIKLSSKYMKARPVTIRKWLADPLIQEEIQVQMALRNERTEVSEDKVVKELAKMAFSNITNVVKWDKKGQVKVNPSADLPDDVTAAISSVEEVINKRGKRQLRVRMHDKKGTLELLARHLGMLLDRNVTDMNLEIAITNYGDEDA